ncbi:MAG: SAM-dependent methyltransferase [Novosphingobium sp. 17-62-19]|uniref:class I SAM-dependent DNA methyltransferase n=1 Tax=Novosphingobium sp. 17-62-19 TaxID=1970406 RepID=UPI000BDA768A|nr:DNA methyltransferase [Novosphingobium sp. 17-62-19]OZA16735.1 MAG: SAM-dependent methyltransferase [Novosphingobium sp. 17-62-19]HQS98165.1 class I SAM-dependent DNA methyltransferase [Novosphingobium sp.]
MTEAAEIEKFIAAWRDTGGSELANTQSFINGLCHLIGLDAPAGSRTDDRHNDYVFERRVFQDNGDGTQSFGRIDCYKRGGFILEAKQGSEADRAAAEKGEDDLDIFGQTATARVKRGTARRGTPGWAKAMVQAKGQAERYAKALPADHGWPPFLLVADIGYCIEVYADFTGTGKAYAQFPDRARYRIMLEDLRDPDVRERLRAIWTDPKSLDPAARAARVTRDIADLLATVARRLEKRGYNAETTSGFLMRVLFTMFAEDSGLIPERSFTTLLKNQRAHPEHLEHQLSALWAAMDKGEFSPALGVPMKKFNGYLFKERTAIPLDAQELEVLIQAAEHVWTEVEPAIFGTLLERALNPKERAKLGAHYTPRAYVERLIGPTIMEPLRADWDGVRGAAATLIEEGKPDEAKAFVEAFHARLAQTKVLDPACGTGNFLYVAMARMKELEGEVLDLLVELGDDQYVAELTGHTITPENFLGIEINPRAAAIAQLVLWIGYLQWHFRVNGADRAPPEPILRDVKTIENRDALIDWDDRVLERDETGAPVSRWDGETMKVHPVTGKPVPDEDARVEVYRYVKPRAAKWPKADFIVGNPPFIGNKRMRKRLGENYAKALRAAWPKVPKSVDLVMYWWDRCAELTQSGRLRTFGLVSTNSIKQVTNRAVIERWLKVRPALNLSFAIPDHPWMDDETTAQVRISMTVASRGGRVGILETIKSESKVKGQPNIVDLIPRLGQIHSNLTIGANITDCGPLKSNDALSFMGVIPSGTGFRISADELVKCGCDLSNLPSVVRTYLVGNELTDNKAPGFIIDYFGLDESRARKASPALFQFVLNRVKDGRAARSGDTSDSQQYASEWWLFAKPRPGMRAALQRQSRYLATTETSKHRWFTFLHSTILPDQKIRGVATEDAFHLGVLSSRVHKLWSDAAGGRQGVGNDPVYNNTTCFEPFPFPADVPEPLKAKIRAEAEALDALRKRVLDAHEDLTLTRLYNVLEALKAGRALTEAERDMHDRGLVTLIRQHHDAIDALVAQAYGWSADLSDEDILTRLVALNKERAAEEARGLIRWLRPEYQAPDYQAPITQTLDLGEAAAVLPDNVIPWPGSLPEQVSAVQSILSAAQAPLAPQDVARAFKGKRAATVRPVLDALASIGMARRLNDGRYAA